jgi:carboxymethylenebutenolidase
MGITDHFRDVARRLAKEGYLASALDLLSRDGGSDKVRQGDQSKIPAMLSATDVIPRNVADFKAAAEYYLKQSFVKPGAIGMTGFCFGGSTTLRSAEEIPQLKAAVPYYGSVPPLDKVKDVKAAIFGVYSSDPEDPANRDRDKLEQAAKAANVTYQYKVYPNTFHGFNDDTGARYNQEQGLAAWNDTLDWLAKYVKG